MKTLVAVLVLCFATSLVAQAPKEPPTPVTLKRLLLQQLRESHNQKNWFVSGKEAMAGVTPEQSAWTDGKNHSVGQLVQHLVFWNHRVAQQFKGEKPPEAPSDNNETFKYDPKQWTTLVQQFDDDMTQIEKAVEAASDADLQKMAPTAARVAQHNAYHIGEIVMVRKAQGAWNPDNGVK
jgi:hypothetical protein